MIVGSSLFIGFAGKIESRRADSNRLPLLQLRVIGHMLQGCAGACKSRISKPVSLLSFALCCTVLRSRWYQSGVKWYRFFRPWTWPGRSTRWSCSRTDRAACPL